MKIGILDNISKEKTKETLGDFQNYLQKCGHETVYFSELKEINNVDVMIVLGGDGAILHAAVPAAQKHIPIIGINYGNLGFLTEYEKSEREKVQELLTLFSEQKCRIVKRSILEVIINGESYYALNEIAIQRNYGQLVERIGQTQILKLQINGDEGSDLRRRCFILYTNGFYSLFFIGGRRNFNARSACDYDDADMRILYARAPDCFLGFKRFFR